MLNKIKLYPNNSHQDYYRDWLFLGSDKQCDYYMIKSQYACNSSKVWLSIVHSNEPSDYGSPCYDNLIKLDRHVIVTYDTMLQAIKLVSLADLPIHK
jgi:hypothetical protein